MSIIFRRYIDIRCSSLAFTLGTFIVVQIKIIKGKLLNYLLISYEYIRVCHFHEQYVLITIFIIKVFLYAFTFMIESQSKFLCLNLQ